MSAESRKARKTKDRLTLAEGIGIIIVLALLGGLSFGVAAV
jgi:hypothetical protein